MSDSYMEICRSLPMLARYTNAIWDDTSIYTFTLLDDLNSADIEMISI